MVFRMRQVDVAGPATLGDLGPVIDLLADRPVRVENIIDPEQRQFGDANAGGMGEPE